MRKSPVKVAIWGFGAMGSGMAKMILDKKGFDMVGVCDHYPKIIGKSIFSLLNHENPYHHDVMIEDSIAPILERHPDVVLLATDSFTEASFPKIKRLLEGGVNVISTAEEMAFPSANAPELAKQIDEIARSYHKTVLGTGVNPGMMMDLLMITLSGVMTDLSSIEISRINSLSPFGKTVMEEQGVGLSLEAFNEKCARHEISGHVGFKESTAMIASALGLSIERFSQSMEPIITDCDRKSPHGFARKHDVCGVNMRAEALLSQGIPVSLRHPQQIEPELGGVNTGDFITLEGTPKIRMAIQPEVEGGLGTIAICVNMIPHVINARPGLKTMIDLPVPRAIIGDVRAMIEADAL